MVIPSLNKISNFGMAEQLHRSPGMRVEAVVPERSQRAIDIMRSILPEERKVSRVHLTIPASVNCPTLNCQDRLAIMRDLSTEGAFFYAELDGVEGAPITVHFILAAFGKNIRMACDGRIVRVEHFPRGAATGIAVEFLRCNMYSGENC
jgi:hypothetical protein